MPSADIFDESQQLRVAQLTEIRTQATRLVAQLGAAPPLAAPLLQAVTAFEQHMRSTWAHGPTPQQPFSDTSRPDYPLHTDDRADALRHAQSEAAQLHYVLTHAPIGISIFDGPEQRFTLSNPSYDQLAGRTDLLGKTVPEVFPELAGQGIYELIDQVYTTGVPFTAHDLLVPLDRDGDGVVEHVYFDFTYYPLRAADGTITGVIDYVADVSDRHALEQERARVFQLTQAAQQAADAERQRLLDGLRQAPTAICLLAGPHHRYTFTNPYYDRLIGRQNFVGQTVRAVSPEVTGQGFFELLDQVYTTGVPFIGAETPFQVDRTGTGTLEPGFVSFTYVPIRDATTTITGIFVQAVDVTDLVVARQQAEAAVRLRDEFLSIAAHELKTPVTALVGYTQVLQRRLRRDGHSDEPTDRTLTIITTQAQRLTRLMNTLLDVARINMGYLTLERAPLDLGALTSRVVAEVTLTRPQVPIHVNLPPAPCVVLGDELRLEQVLVNLVQNAIKYSPNEAPTAVTVGYDTTHAWVSVRDHGIGIPAAALPHLFERFYRVSGAADAISGMGIGLSVVQDIVTLHGGTVTVESNEGVGSTFTVWLPLADG